MNVEQGVVGSRVVTWLLSKRDGGDGRNNDHPSDYLCTYKFLIEHPPCNQRRRDRLNEQDQRGQAGGNMSVCEHQSDVTNAWHHNHERKRLQLGAREVSDLIHVSRKQNERDAGYGRPSDHRRDVGKGVGRYFAWSTVGMLGKQEIPAKCEHRADRGEAAEPARRLRSAGSVGTQDRKSCAPQCHRGAHHLPKSNDFTEERLGHEQHHDRLQ